MLLKPMFFQIVDYYHNKNACDFPKPQEELFFPQKLETNRLMLSFIVEKLFVFIYFANLPFSSEDLKWFCKQNTSTCKNSWLKKEVSAVSLGSQVYNL